MYFKNMVISECEWDPKKRLLESARGTCKMKKVVENLDGTMNVPNTSTDRICQLVCTSRIWWYLTMKSIFKECLLQPLIDIYKRQKVIENLDGDVNIINFLPIRYADLYEVQECSDL